MYLVPYKDCSCWKLPPVKIYDFVWTNNSIINYCWFYRYSTLDISAILFQIEWNLVIAPGLAQPSAETNSGAKTTTDSGLLKARIYCEVPYIETSYRRQTQDETSMRPKFYSLTNAEINNQVNYLSTEFRVKAVYVLLFTSFLAPPIHRLSGVENQNTWQS